MKGGRRTEKRDTTTNITKGGTTTTTKRHQPEIAETYGYPKRHQGRFKKGRKQTPIYRGSVCGLRSRLNYLGTLNKAQQELEYSKK